MARFNKCVNPSAIIDATGWRKSPSAGTATRVTGLSGPPRSTGCSQAVTTSSFSGSLSSARAVSVNGQTWTAAGWLMCSVARTLRASLTSWASDSVTASSTGQTAITDLALGANTWTEFVITGVVSDVRAGFHCDVPTSGTAGTIYMSSVRLEQITDAAMDYADGDSAGWVWDGTVSASTSTEPDLILDTRFFFASAS